MTTPARAPEDAGALRTLEDGTAETPTMVGRRSPMVMGRVKVRIGTTGMMAEAAMARQEPMEHRRSGAEQMQPRPPLRRRRTAALYMRMGTDERTMRPDRAMTVISMPIRETVTRGARAREEARCRLTMSPLVLRRAQPRRRTATERGDRDRQSYVIAARADRSGQAYIVCIKGVTGRKGLAKVMIAPAALEMMPLGKVDFAHMKGDIGAGRQEHGGVDWIGDMMKPVRLANGIVEKLMPAIEAGRPPMRRRRTSRPHGLRPRTEAPWSTELVKARGQSVRAAASHAVQAIWTAQPVQPSRMQAGKWRQATGGEDHVPDLEEDHQEPKYRVTPTECLSPSLREKVAIGTMHPSKPEGHSTPMRRVLSEGPTVRGGVIHTGMTAATELADPVRATDSATA